VYIWENKKFPRFIKKLQQKFESSRLQEDDITRTPSSNRVLSESNTPSTPAPKKWPFKFKYPEYRIKDDPVFDKLAIPELELRSGDLTKIVVPIFQEIRTYGDAL
jgi:hypothetical protein